MKKLLLIFNFAFLIFTCPVFFGNSAFPQAGMWTWMKGDSALSGTAYWGTIGVANPLNTPPGLYEAAEWKDAAGNFWVFGGLNWPAGYIFYNDLWKYDVTTNNWTWIKGTGLPNDLGNYGTQGIPSPANLPPARGFGCATWSDMSGNFWMFGGANMSGYYGDLWKYNMATNMWTWVKGSITPDPAVHGVKGIPSPLNTPGARAECSSTWVDNTGNLWLFGGDIGSSYFMNDLWRYSISTNEWTWMSGDSVPYQLGVYGTLGIPAPANKPGARWSYCSWKDNNGNLWLFGGGQGLQTQFNDMWKYDPSINQWAWMSGSNQTGNQGTYNNSLCTPDSSYAPAARYENRARWTDDCGMFYLYSGGRPSNGIFDLWQFDPVDVKWSRINGSSTTFVFPVYGVQGIPSSANTPGTRWGAPGWISNTGDFYVFGGYVKSWQGIRSGNEMWKFTLDSNCTNCTTAITEHERANEFSVYPNPAGSRLKISFQSVNIKKMELSIYNTLGKQIYFSKEEITKGKFEKEINVGKWSEGIYFLQMKIKEGVVSKKVVIQH